MTLRNGGHQISGPRQSQRRSKAIHHGNDFALQPEGAQRCVDQSFVDSATRYEHMVTSGVARRSVVR